MKKCVLEFSNFEVKGASGESSNAFNPPSRSPTSKPKKVKKGIRKFF